MSELERIPDWMMTPDTPGPQPIDLKVWAQEFRDVYQVAEALCKTPFVPPTMLGKQADVAAAIMKGRELGLDPFDALASIFIVHGRVGYYAEFQRRRIIQAGHTFRIVESTESRCIVEGVRKDSGETHRATFTVEQARKAGIDLGKYPAEKLVARATSRLCRQVFPDVLSGSLIAEDLIDGLIPPDDTEQPAPTTTNRPALQRKRATKAPTAAATQPPPAPKPDADTDITELLGEQPATQAAANPDPAPVGWGDMFDGIDQFPGPPTDPQSPDPHQHPNPAEGQRPGHDPRTLPAESPDLCDPATRPDDDKAPMISKPQLVKLHILLKESELGDRDTGLAWLSEAVGRHVDTSKALTQDEANRVIDILENSA
jgi:hypothetical protein